MRWGRRALDSRLRGNDGGGCGNDGDKWGNDVDGGGSEGGESSLSSCPVKGEGIWLVIFIALMVTQRVSEGGVLSSARISNCAIIDRA